MRHILSRLGWRRQRPAQRSYELVRGLDFAGKVALVTGGGAGIGEATARLLGACGATVGIIDLKTDRVEAVAGAIRGAGGKAIGRMADISDEQQTRAAIDGIAEEAGRLDIVVANAGINGVWAPIDDLTPAEFDRTVAVNFRGTYLTLHFAVPHLKRAGGGAIVVTSSIQGTRTKSIAGASAYGATKAAQLAMVEYLAVELSSSGIRVNAVAPGSTVTKIGENTATRNLAGIEFPRLYPETQIPLGRDWPPADVVADSIGFLCSDLSRHVTGTLLVVDGAQSLVV